MRDERTLYNLREQQESSAKTKVAKKATKLIKDGDVIMFDASTTVYSMVHFLEGFDDLLV